MVRAASISLVSNHAVSVYAGCSRAGFRNGGIIGALLWCYSSSLFVLGMVYCL
jgi:hypothetical protein